MRFDALRGRPAGQVEQQRPVDRRARAGRRRSPSGRGTSRVAAHRRVDRVAVADLAVAVAEGGVGELERDVRLVAERVVARALVRELGRQLGADQRRAGSRGAGSTGSATSSPAAPRRRCRARATPSSRRRSTTRLWARMNATWSWLTKRWTSLRGSPISARPSWLRGTSFPPAPEQQLRRIVALVEVRAPDGAAAVEALEVQARRAEVAQRVLLGVRAERRAVGGDVVGDELADERPAGRDGRVVVARRSSASLAVARAAGRRRSCAAAPRRPRTAAGR